MFQYRIHDFLVHGVFNSEVVSKFSFYLRAMKTQLFAPSAIFVHLRGFENYFGFSIRVCAVLASEPCFKLCAVKLKLTNNA